MLLLMLKLLRLIMLQRKRLRKRTKIINLMAKTLIINQRVMIIRRILIMKTPLISLTKATKARMMTMIKRKRKIILLKMSLNILNLKLSMMNYRPNSQLLKLKIIA